MALSIFKTAKTWKLIQQMNQVCVFMCVLDREKNGNKPCQMVFLYSLLISSSTQCARDRWLWKWFFFGSTVKSILINYYVTCTKHRGCTWEEEEEEEKCTRFYIGTEWMNEKRIINSFLHVFLYCKWREVRTHSEREREKERTARQQQITLNFHCRFEGIVLRWRERKRESTVQ